MSTKKTAKKSGIDSKTKAALQKIPLLSLKAGTYNNTGTRNWKDDLFRLDELFFDKQVRDRPSGLNV